MTKMLENKMLLETAADPQEQDPDEAYDRQRAALSDKEYADLKAELITITLIQAQTSRIENLTKELQDLLLGRRQA